MIPEPVSSKNPKPKNFIRQLLDLLIAPSPQLTEPDQRRQAAFLSAFLLGVIGVATLSEAITVAFIDWETYTGYQATFVTVIVLALIYGISRTRHVRLAAILAVVIASLATFVTGWTQPRGVLGGLLDFLILPLWLGSLYLSLEALGILIVANLIGLLIFPWLSPEVTFNDILVGPFSFILATSLILLLITNQRNKLERDRRMQLVEQEQQSRREAARSAALLRVAEHLNSQLDLDTLLKDISTEVTLTLGVPISLVALYDAKKNTLDPAAGEGLPPELIHSLAPLPKVLFDQIIQEVGTRYAAQNIQEIIGLPGIDRYMDLNLRSIAFALMMHEKEIIGSLNAITDDETRLFSEDELLLLQGLADQAALAIVNTRSYKDAQRRMEYLQALRAIDLAIASHRDSPETFDLLLKQITTQLEVDAAAILVSDKEQENLSYAASRGFRTEALRFTRLRLGEGIAGRAAQRNEVIRIDNLRIDPKTLAKSPTLAEEGFISYYAAPLITQGQVTGVLEIFHRSPLDPSQEWLDFLETLAGQTAIAVESTSMFADLQHMNEELFNAYDATIEGWSRALDLRDKETEGHTLRVTELTLEMARAFGFDDDELVHVRRGGLLHDIGKMGIPDRILLKEGPLTPNEWEHMRKHPVYAYEMLLPVEYLRPALDIPYCHHEKWDGTGYPQGLKGDDIPLIARIFAVVDVWDALTSDRPYRPAWPREKALAHIREQAGSHFDPHVVEVFLGLIEQNPLDISL